MAIGVRDLKNRASEILRQIQRRGKGVTVTRHGRPAALLLPIDTEEAEDYILSHAPEIVASLRHAERDLRAGRGTDLRTLRKRRGL
jgi:antitoxin YefM